MLHELLKNEGLVVNKKRTYRLYTQARLQLRTMKSDHTVHWVINHPVFLRIK